MTPIYTMEFRPVGFGTLPTDIITEWVKLPKHDGHLLARAFPGLETSEHTFGEFTTNRPLTEDEIRSYQVKQLNASDPLRPDTILATDDFAAVEADRGSFSILPRTDTARKRLAEYWEARGASTADIQMALKGDWDYPDVFAFVDTWDNLTNCHRP